MFPVPADAASILTVDLGILIALLLMAVLLDRRQPTARALFGGTTGLFILTYAAWRWHDTLPSLEMTAESLWPHIFFAFELVAILYSAMSIVILLRTSDRSGEADIAQNRLAESGAWPAVDIFICTYNEPLSVIEKSILPALAIDYPNATVWVLDDTRRQWLRDYCETAGANYLTRPDNHGAKAGNLNNALKATAALSNAPIILVLDADFAPSRALLRRTVGLFSDQRVAVVQTPQFFYNADPIQHNLMAAEHWVDDQRIFFDVFQPAKDAWGCAFCVGTSFLVRRDRLEEIGGFPDAAICEDINLTYTLMARGYETRWLNERLSVGLSAEGLPEYITQRTRWCLGTIQVALLKTGPFFGKGFTLIQRLHYLHGMLNWLCKPYIVLMLVAPSIYWFAGLPAFQADYLSFLRYGLPALFALWVYGGWISGSRTLPLFMEVTHIITAPAVTATLISAAIRPFGRPFKVTDKGGDRTRSTIRWKMAAIFGAIALASGGSIIWSMISPTAASEISSLDYFNLLWAGVSMVFSFVAFLVCFERPREESRFSVTGEAFFTSADTSVEACQLVNLSTAGARLRLPCPTNSQVYPSGTPGWLHLAGLGWIAATTHHDPHRLHLNISLNPTAAQHQALILCLFCDPIDQIARTASLHGAFRTLIQRCFKAA